LGRVRGYEAGAVIVEVAYGRKKPPYYVWYLVADDGSVLNQLSKQEIEQRFGHLPFYYYR
jgi:hypothetical protein